MPLIHSLSLSTHVNAHFWKVEKTETSLLEQLPLNAADEQLLAKKKKAADRYSFLAVRALLQVVGCTASVVYDAQGAPTLSNGQRLSISHTHHYVAVVLSDQLPVGIDVEAYRPKIARIAPRFMHASEAFANTLPLMTQLWTAKEAVYKALRQPGIHFAEHIHIEQFTANTAAATATVWHNARQQEFSLTFVSLNEHCATIALPK